MKFEDHKLYVHTAYDWIDNPDGELMLVMDKTKGTADDENAKIIFDGSGQALLIRNKNQIVHLPVIVEDIKNYLNKLKEILVTEMDGDDIDDTYEAKVEIVTTPLAIPKEVYDRYEKLK